MENGPCSENKEDTLVPEQYTCPQNKEDEPCSIEDQYFRGFVFCPQNKDSTEDPLVPTQDTEQLEGGDSELIETLCDIEANVTDLLSGIPWSVVTYAQFWGIKFGDDDRRKALVCDMMPFMIEYSRSAAGEKEHIDSWKYRGFCESVAHVIDHVKDNDHEEGSKSCPLISAAFACGLKLCSKTRKLKVYNQVGFGRTLFAIFSEPRMADKKKKSISTPKLATKPLLSGKESRKRGLSAGDKPEAGCKRAKPATGSTAEGGQTLPPLTLTAMDDFLTLKVRILEAPMVECKPFKRKVISYISASLMTMQETVEECIGVGPGAYAMSYHDEDGDLIVLGCDEDIKDALKFSKEENNNVLKIEVKWVNVIFVHGLFTLLVNNFSSF
nr:hypothetical protein [Tanacetum cinerariifolium]